jgi:hypothetical protein
MLEGKFRKLHDLKILMFRFLYSDSHSTRVLHVPIAEWLHVYSILINSELVKYWRLSGKFELVYKKSRPF